MSGVEAIATMQAFQGLATTTTTTTTASVEQLASTSFGEPAPEAPPERATSDAFDDALLRFSSEASLEALNLLETITRNVVQRPEEERCRCLRTSNEKLAPLLGWPGATELMQTMGWQLEDGLLILPTDAQLDKFPEYVTQITNAKERCFKPRATITGGVINRARVPPSGYQQKSVCTAGNAVSPKSFERQGAKHAVSTKAERRERATTDAFDDALLRFSSEASLEALNLLEIISRNVVQRPEDERCRCLRISNEKLAPLLGLLGATELMQTMGWQEEADLLTLPMDAQLDKFPEYVTQITKAKERCFKPRATITGGVINRARATPSGYKQQSTRTAGNAVSPKSFERRGANHDGDRAVPTEVERREQCYSELRKLENERRQRADAAKPAGEGRDTPLLENQNSVPSTLDEDWTLENERRQRADAVPSTLDEDRTLENERRQRADAAKPAGEGRDTPLLENQNAVPSTLDEDNTYDQNQGCLCKWLAGLFGRDSSRRGTGLFPPVRIVNYRQSEMTIADLERRDRQEASNRAAQQAALQSGLRLARVASARPSLYSLARLGRGGG